VRCCALNAECGVGAERRQRIKDFHDASYFSTTSDVETFKANASDVQADFELLPDSEKKGMYALEEALLDKMPVTMTEEVAKYKRKIEKAEDMDEVPKWKDYDGLVKMLASDFLRTVIRHDREEGDDGWWRRRHQDLCTVRHRGAQGLRQESRRHVRVHRRLRRVQLAPVHRLQEGRAVHRQGGQVSATPRSCSMRVASRTFPMCTSSSRNTARCGAPRTA